MQNQVQANAPVRFLEGQIVYLRPLSSADTELYFQKLFNPEVRKLTGTQRNFTKEQIHQYFERIIQDSSRLSLLIALRETDEVIGDFELQNMDSYNRNANIRILIDEEHH